MGLNNLHQRVWVVFENTAKILRKIAESRFNSYLFVFEVLTEDLQVSGHRNLLFLIHNCYSFTYLFFLNSSRFSEDHFL